MAPSLGPAAAVAGGAGTAERPPASARAGAPSTPCPASPALRRKLRRSASFSALRLIMSVTTFLPNMLLLGLRVVPRDAATGAVVRARSTHGGQQSVPYQADQSRRSSPGSVRTSGHVEPVREGPLPAGVSPHTLRSDWTSDPLS